VNLVDGSLAHLILDSVVLEDLRERCCKVDAGMGLPVDGIRTRPAFRADRSLTFATSTMSNKNDTGTPFDSKWTVTAT
jgi:hypothetical protein